MLRVLKRIPLLTYLIIMYNVVTVGRPVGTTLDTAVFTTQLISGSTLSLTVGDLFVALGVLILYVEIFKSTRSSVDAIIDHLLSMLLFVVCLVEFLIFPRGGTVTFLLLTLIALLDVIAGFTISISTARRDFAVGDRL